MELFGGIAISFLLCAPMGALAMGMTDEDDDGNGVAIGFMMCLAPSVVWVLLWLISVIPNILR